MAPPLVAVGAPAGDTLAVERGDGFSAAVPRQEPLHRPRAYTQTHPSPKPGAGL